MISSTACSRLSRTIKCKFLIYSLGLSLNAFWRSLWIRGRTTDDDSSLNESLTVYIALLRALALPPLHPVRMALTKSAFESLQMPIPRGRDIWLTQHFGMSYAGRALAHTASLE